MQPLANKQKKTKKYLKTHVHGITQGTSKKNLAAEPEGLSPFFFKDFLIWIVKIMCLRAGQGLQIYLQKQKPIVNKQHPCLVKFGRTICNS